MKKVGFFIAPTTEWIGGINYLKNLFGAINDLNDKSYEIIIFLPKNIDEEIEQIFGFDNTNFKIIKTLMLQRKSLYWFFWKIIRNFFNTDIVAFPLCAFHKLDIVSHSDFTNIPSVKIINWIPDFQHHHLPEVFTKKEVQSRDKSNLRHVKGADKVIVSSDEVAKDFAKLYPNEIHKLSILKFSCSLPDFYWGLNLKDFVLASEVYGLTKNYIYVPNQFWQHKNHLVLIGAVEIIKRRGLDILIVCSGHTNDYRNPQYFENFKKNLIDKKCLESFRILGVIPPRDVYLLLKFSLAVINPSIFEGWSTTVEEFKAAGKVAILSDLKVHREQMDNAFYFDAKNSESLANHLEYILANVENPLNINSKELILKNNIKKFNFAKSYLNVVKSI